MYIEGSVYLLWHKSSILPDNSVLLGVFRSHASAHAYAESVGTKDYYITSSVLIS